MEHMAKRPGCNLQSPRSASGFTLLECLVALIILSIGLVSVFALFVAGAASHKKGVDQTTAGILAQKVLAELQEACTDDTLTALAGKDKRKRSIALKDQVDPAFPAYKYDLALQALDARRDAYAVTLRVRWLERGTQEAAVFETVILRKND